MCEHIYLIAEFVSLLNVIRYDVTQYNTCHVQSLILKSLLTRYRHAVLGRAWHRIRGAARQRVKSNRGIHCP